MISEEKDKNSSDTNSDVSMEDIISLTKRRGFVYPGSDIYGGLANSWDFGPLGVEIKRNIKNIWWKTFVHKRKDMYGLDAAIIMNRKVWQSSGHEKIFADPLVECESCHKRFREDDLNSALCPSCKGKLSEAKQFNLLFKTFVGPIDNDQALTYLRGETAQGIFVNFKNVLNTFSPKIPFGIAQIGKAFRNEITPGNFIFRTREFEQMEIEYFIKEDQWEEKFEYWRKQTGDWIKRLGIDEKRTHFTEILKEDLAHYSKRTIDVEFDFSFGRKELYGLAYRTDFDLTVHQKGSGKSLEYLDQETNKKFIPHIIEPSLGVERIILALFASVYRKSDNRIWLDFNIDVAPYKVAVFPLLKNKKVLVDKAKQVYEKLVNSDIGQIAWDDRGNIGKRYLSQDEVGTPYCFTVDFQTIEDGTITVRDRNTTKQERIKIDDAVSFLRSKFVF